MWVHSKYRGRGYGQALLEAVINWAKSKNFQEVKLWVPSSNQLAKSFYEKAGFVYTGRVRDEQGRLRIEEMLVSLKRFL